MTRLLAALLALALFGCGDLPVVPVVPPPTPTPVGPPVTPPVGSGAIDEAGFAAIDEDAVGADGVVRNGTAEAAMLARLGPPYMKATAAGFTIYRYALVDASGRATGHVVAFWVQNGRVNHRSRL